MTMGSPTEVAMELMSQQGKATLFLGALAIFFLLALLGLFLALRAQKAYDTDALPTLPGMEEEEVTPEEEVDTTSAFQLDDEDNLHAMGDREAVDLFKEMRAASAAPEKSKRRGILGKKS